MALDFPNNPSGGQTYTSGGITYTYNSTVGIWQASAPAGFTGSLGYTGSTGNFGYSGSQGATGTAATSINGFFPGLNTSQTGQLRRYMPFNITMTKFTAWVTPVSTATNLILTLNKNGTPVTTLTILAGNFFNTATISSSILADTDYITIDITSGSGYNIGTRIDYNLS